MNAQDALDRLDTIPHQLSRFSPGHGCRAATVAWTAFRGRTPSRFCLAIYVSLPRLPQGVGMIGCLYFVAGAWALSRSAAVATSPWTMGCVFGVNQARAAWILARFPEGAEFPRDRRGGW